MALNEKRKSKSLNLLSLPYDIRFLIYSHLFPQMSQIYLMAKTTGLDLMHPPDYLQLSILSTCSQLYTEASGYLYNNYLFNTVGYKRHCMAHYGTILELLDKHAHHGAKIDVLDNGSLSMTACVSMYAKDGHVEAMARKRQRGVRRALRDVEVEAAAMPAIPDVRSDYWQGTLGLGMLRWSVVEAVKWRRLAVAVTAVCVAVLAVWLALGR